MNGDPTYTAGPQVCGGCHPDHYDDWLSHGHSRKLAPGPWLSQFSGSYGLSAEARASGFTLPDHDPDVYNRDNILMIVGGSKHWKTRFVGMDGYIITTNGRNQYNWMDGSFTDYHANEVKPFDCGSCHTTGYRPDGPAFTPYAPGVVGDWSHFNITCEACHGPGQEHANTGDPTKITIDRSAALCGNCHTRGDDPNVILASGGFIRHHEQYPELLNSPHSWFSCGDCHDPHETRAKGIKVPAGFDEICESCHRTQTTQYEGSTMQLAGVKCQDCHMGRATKSAIAKGPYEGDVWTHLFRIDSSADYWMFTDDGSQAKNALSLEFACFRCHADADKAAFAAIGNNGYAYHTIGKPAPQPSAQVVKTAD